MEHKYDKGGICIYCDMCADWECCGRLEPECSRWKVKQLQEITERLQEEWKERRSNSPTESQ